MPRTLDSEINKTFPIRITCWMDRSELQCLNLKVFYLFIVSTTANQVYTELLQVKLWAKPKKPSLAAFRLTQGGGLLMTSPSIPPSLIPQSLPAPHLAPLPMLPSN